MYGLSIYEIKRICHRARFFITSHGSFQHFANFLKKKHDKIIVIFILISIITRGRPTLIFSIYVGSGPASTVHPKKYQEFWAPQKMFEILETPKNIPHSVPCPLEKTLKCIEMTPKYRPILW